MINAEFDEYMVKKYPKIFAHRRKNMRETAMCWGFEVGDGWHTLIDVLCAQIQYYIDWSRTQRARAISYNRVLKRAINGDTKGLEWYYSYAMQQIELDIENQVFREVIDKVDQVVAIQVKEKFGELRFYYNGGDEYIRGVVDMASAMSVHTCETCGNVGKQSNKGGWVRTTCEEHAK